MVAQNTAETDEQIIDLTELIEKGEVPANDPSEQSRAHAAAEAEAEKEELQEHLRDLNDGTNKADAEIDDLLAQMDIKADGQEDPEDVALDFSAPSTQTDHHIDPNEQLNMPGMGDVDSLLDSLDIPPQPSDREAETASPETPDQAVDALLNDFNAPVAPAAEPTTAANHDAPDLDELLASVGAAPHSDTSSPIDDLLSAASPAAAPAAAPQTALSNDDLDSLLEAATGGQSGTPSPIQTAEPAPRPAAAPQPAPSTSMDVDIDSLLAAAANDMQQDTDLEQPAAAPAPQPVAPAAPVAAPAAASADMGVDIACWLPPPMTCNRILRLPSLPPLLQFRRQFRRQPLLRHLPSPRLLPLFQTTIWTACWLPQRPDLKRPAPLRRNRQRHRPRPRLLPTWVWTLTACWLRQPATLSRLSTLPSHPPRPCPNLLLNQWPRPSPTWALISTACWPR